MPKSYETCPSCKVSLQGEPIPKRSREHFGNATHFSRKIGLYSRELDRTTAWRCPDCGHTWNR
jgi:rubredoxin